MSHSPSQASTAIFADKLWRVRRTGVGRVIEGLAGGLAELGVDACLVGYRSRGAEGDGRYGLPVVELPASRATMALRARIGFDRKIDPLLPASVTVLHNTNLASPVRTDLPAVVTVYDLSPIDLAGEYSPAVRRSFVRSLETSEQRGDVALCVSNATATRLLQVAPGFIGRVVVGHLGPSRRLSGRSPSPESTRVLVVGELTRRKRPDLVIRAFEHARLPAPWRLTFAGNPGNAFEAVTRQIDRSRSGDRIDVVVSPSDQELAGLYGSSSFLVLASDAEGFGIPVLDAISAGLPVIVTEGTSLPEVAGPGGRVVERGNTEELAEAIQALATDSDQCEQLSIAGREHAKRFSWRVHAEAAVRAHELARSVPGF